MSPGQFGEHGCLVRLGLLSPCGTILVLLVIAAAYGTNQQALTVEESGRTGRYPVAAVTSACYEQVSWRVLYYAEINPLLPPTIANCPLLNCGTSDVHRGAARGEGRDRQWEPTALVLQLSKHSSSSADTHFLIPPLEREEVFVLRKVTPLYLQTTAVPHLRTHLRFKAARMSPMGRSWCLQDTPRTLQTPKRICSGDSASA